MTMNIDIMNELVKIENENVRIQYRAIFERMNEYAYEKWKDKHMKIIGYIKEQKSCLPVEILENVNVTSMTLYKHIDFLVFTGAVQKSHSRIIWNE